MPLRSYMKNVLENIYVPNFLQYKAVGKLCRQNSRNFYNDCSLFETPTSGKLSRCRDKLQFNDPNKNSLMTTHPYSVQTLSSIFFHQLSTICSRSPQENSFHFALSVIFSFSEYTDAATAEVRSSFSLVQHNNSFTHLLYNTSNKQKIRD